MRLLITSLLLVLIFTVSAPAQTQRTTSQKSPASSVVYACPMHPDVTSTKPGHFRKCGMTLRPVASDRVAVGDNSRPEDGLNVVSLDARRARKGL